ncbi:MAG TPA: helix-turn-helix domain-containing protein [Methanospirillum sp.]|uniref:TrmB family transcriptional regulator n=1 Tax=Methanospirillum sp. TaxID=45200 RepID=UPI002C17AAA8|nr:helix-turn-helix domain-containing protein [Methanospirillum sp.]HWQ64605.1 helix-turn-helix domain-containing protein [Methanospirillum sp.]
MRVYVTLLSMTMNIKTIRLLQRLGLTAYEAKAYAVLAQAGTLSPFDLAEESGIPRTKIYDTIRRLERENLVLVEKGRPSKISAICPTEAIRGRKAILDAEIDQMTNEFKMNFDKHKKQDVPRSNIIHGLDNIVIRTTDMMQRAKASLYLFGTLYYPEEVEPIKQQIEAVKKRGVIIRISTNNPILVQKKMLDVSESFTKVINDLQVAPEPFIRTMTIDNKEMLMMFPLPEADQEYRENVIALWIDNETVTKAINNVFNITWGNRNWVSQNQKISG